MQKRMVETRAKSSYINRKQGLAKGNSCFYMIDLVQLGLSKNFVVFVVNLNLSSRGIENANNR